MPKSYDDYEREDGLVNDFILKKCSPCGFFQSLPDAETRFVLHGSCTVALSLLGYMAIGTPVGAGAFLYFGWQTLKSYANNKIKQKSIVKAYIEDNPDLVRSTTNIFELRDQNYKKYGILLGGNESDDLLTHRARIHNAIALRDITPKPLIDLVEATGEELKRQVTECLRTNRRA